MFNILLCGRLVFFWYGTFKLRRAIILLIVYGEYVSRKLRFITALKTYRKIIFSELILEFWEA